MSRKGAISIYRPLPLDSHPIWRDVTWRKLEAKRTMPMLQLIYASRPFGYDVNMLASILATSRRRNAQGDVTGALICRSDIFLQLLEGPLRQVEATFQRICADDRHMEIVKLVAGPVEDRLFPNWAMKHDPAESWLYSPQQIHEGALMAASEKDVRAIFVRSAEA